MAVTPNSGYEVESSIDFIYLDGDEEDEVMCLRCTGGEDTTIDEDPLDEDIDNLEKKLMAQVVNNEEEAYKVYCDYAHVVGFSVRKGKQYYFPGTKRIRSKTYFCSKEGFMNEDISVATHNKLEARTGCKAMISFTCDNDGKWKVTKFLKDHNHKMAEPYERHLLRSARSISDTAKGNITSQSMMLGKYPSFIFKYITLAWYSIALNLFCCNHICFVWLIYGTNFFFSLKSGEQTHFIL